MAKLKRKERQVILACSECKGRNYITHFVMKGGKRLDIRKFCPTCRKHTPHRSRRVD